MRRSRKPLPAVPSVEGSNPSPSAQPPSGGGRVASLGCRAHTGWAVLVVVAGGASRPEVVLRSRDELGDPSGRVRKNAYHAARTLDLAAAAELVEAAERIATRRAESAIDGAVRRAAEDGAIVRSCAVVVGASGDAPLETIVKSHALVHAAEGRLYQRALLQAA